MIDNNGNKILLGDDAPYDLDFALKEIYFFAKQMRNTQSEDTAYSIAKMIDTYLDKGGEHALVYDLFYEIEAYAKGSLNDSFIWTLVYIRRAFSDDKKSKKEYCEAFEHRLAAAKYFDQICEINPSFHNKRVRVWELMITSDIALSSKKRDMYGSEIYRAPLKRAIELLSELEKLPEAEGNEAFLSTAKSVYHTEAVFMEKNKIVGKEWLDCLKKLIYYTRLMYCMQPVGTTYLDDLSIFYSVALYCDGYATSEVLAELNELCRISEERLKEYSYMKKSVEKLIKVRDRCAKMLNLD